jgi:hypothetical protein
MFFYQNVLYRMLTVIAVSSLAVSCVTETVDTTPRMKFSDTAVVSVKDAGNAIAAGSTIAWQPEAVRFYDDKRLQDAHLKTLIESEIVNNLQAKKMRVVDSTSGASYIIAYAAALESSLDDSAIIQHFGLLPGKAPVETDNENVEKGSLIIYVINKKSDRVVWRSAAQAGVQFDATAEQRSARVKQLVSEMFQTFPVSE